MFVWCFVWDTKKYRCKLFPFARSLGIAKHPILAQMEYPTPIQVQVFTSYIRLISRTGIWRFQGPSASKSKHSISLCLSFQSFFLRHGDKCLSLLFFLFFVTRNQFIHLSDEILGKGNVFVQIHLRYVIRAIIVSLLP